MKTYTYVAKDTTGKTIKGSFEAETPQEVMDNPTDPETQAFFAAYNRI